MLAGIGGRSIVEAKERLSYREVLRWKAYFQKRGRPNLGLRIEEAAAYIVAATYQSQGGKCDAKKLMPHVIQQEEESVSLEGVAAMLMASARANKGRKQNGK